MTKQTHPKRNKRDGKQREARSGRKAGGLQRKRAAKPQPEAALPWARCVESHRLLSEWYYFSPWEGVEQRDIENFAMYGDVVSQAYLYALRKAVRRIFISVSARQTGCWRKSTPPGVAGRRRAGQSVVGSGAPSNASSSSAPARWPFAPRSPPAAETGPAPAPRCAAAPGCGPHPATRPARGATGSRSPNSSASGAASPARRVAPGSGC